ncbi:MAG: hypothetical protein J7J93_00350 [Candidatus Aenigmarchaeota archaeon]|nr:hypothetical protein [Candidatus Aenigmarchaeota archaeon]
MMKNIEKTILECPFCNKKTIKAIYFPPVLQSATSRSAAKGSVTKFYKTKEKYEIQSGCSNCGKSKKEIEKVMKEGKKDSNKEKKILERLKKQGLLKSITTKL